MAKRTLNLFLLIAAIVLLAAPLCAQDRKAKEAMPPSYPEVAKSMHLSGSVKVQITIDQKGSVKDAKIVGGHPLLADAAVRAIQKWRYEPGPEETKIVQVDFKRPD